MPKRFASKETAKDAIVAAAGRKMRETGFDGIGVDGLMREAGLTSGAFYTQFGSKKELLLAVLGDGLEDLQQLFGEWQRCFGDDWLAQGLNEYLSEEHRQATSAGCVLPALSIEAARAAGDCQTKTLFEEKLGELVERFAEPNQASGATSREKLWASLCLMTGGILLARAVAKAETADEILTACKKAAGEL